MNLENIGFRGLTPHALSEIGDRLRQHYPPMNRLPNDELFTKVKREAVLAAIAAIHGMPAVEELKWAGSRNLLQNVDIGRKHCFVPIEVTEEFVVVAIGNPYNNYTQAIRGIFPGRQISSIVTYQDEVLKTLAEERSFSPVSDAELRGLELVSNEEEEECLDLNIEDSDPIRRHVQSILVKALQSNASDIHIINDHERAYYKLRVNGDLTEAVAIDKKMVSNLDSIILQLSKIDTQERNSGYPLDGQLPLKLADGSKQTCRYCRMPLERRVLFHTTIRLFQTEKHEVTLDKVFDPASLRYVRKVLDLPTGVIIMSGPTGMGKSTTLQAMIKEVSRSIYNIMTLENPVERRMPGVSQINVRDVSHMNKFLTGTLRSDPDILSIGEVRDIETARNMMEAAITGHQVFATLHTNEAALIPLRLIGFGADKMSIAETLKGLAAQRLVRGLCKHCREEQSVTEELAHHYGLPKEMRGTTIYKSSRAKCPHCRQGYDGRLVIAEFLPVDSEIAEFILASDFTAKMLRDRIWKKFELPTMYDRALTLLKAGDTDLESIKDGVGLSLS